MKLLQLFNEAVKMAHFNDRVQDRLMGPYTTFSDESPEIKKAVFQNIALLSQINFTGQDNIGVLIYNSAKPYIYDRMVNGKHEHTEGNFMWVVVRGNDMETIIFGNSSYRPQNTQIQLKLGTILQYIRDFKNGDTTLTDKDLKRLVNPTAQALPPKEVQPVFIIGGVKWVLTDDKSVLIKKNNPADKMSLDDALAILPDADAERLIDLI